MKKKILVLTNVWNVDYISKLIRGAQRRAGEEAADFYIFNGYDIVGNQQRAKKECEIYALPDPEKYDGILVVISSADSMEMVQGLIETYKRLGKKFICAEMETEEAYYAGVHNYRATRRVLEHMHKVHGCMEFNYISGPKDHWESVERLKAFRDYMEEYHLPLDEERIIMARFEYEDGIRAYQTLKQKGKHLPEAVICANDDMALGYCKAAAEDGYYPPEDFKITGFDNLSIAEQAFPSITSINRNWEQLGFSCMDALLKMIDGESCPKKIYVEERLVCNESCGCKKQDRNIRDYFAKNYAKRKQEERFMERQRQVRQLLCGCLNTQEMCSNLIKCCEIFGMSDIALYLNQTFGKASEQPEGYADHMLVLHNGKIRTADRHEEPMPEKWLEDQKSKIFLFAPLHFLNQTFGYCVMPYEERLLLNDNHRNLMDTISLALENIHQRLELNRMNRKLHQLYTRDSLTGICNRCGYSEEADRFYQSHNGMIYVVYLDVDNLKMVNDTYGHKIGDYVIQIAADAMKFAFDEGEILVRMGGDEFLVIGSFEMEEKVLGKMSRIDEFLNQYVKDKQLPFSLTISKGYVYNAEKQVSVEELVQAADHLMYVNKQKRKESK